MKRINDNGSSVSYFHEGDGKNVLFLHGTNIAGKSSFGHVLTYFTDKYTALVTDYAGCGQSTLPDGPISIEQLADQAALVITDNGKEPVDIVGTSLGAVVAATVAARYPSLVRKLVLTAPWADGKDPRHTLMFSTWLQLEKTSPREATAFGLSHVLSPVFLSALGSEKLATLCARPSENDSARRIELGLNLDINAYLTMVKMPTLIVALTDDTLIPRYQVEKVHRQISGSKYIEIQSGHAVQIESPDIWARTVRDFLDL
ncbi:alpha/beta fold hydrolase [Martelella alba]|uniref:Alpha/beta hydrolase n=1 Tax=Martelella alba TaxID=2590451 RepID=A0ABY2SEE9_9HYPH|nr:alpha/beta hydrolase [Martelella alba]TKI02348.1 alpha/beta hydrolase [Martelella alba]